MKKEPRLPEDAEKIGIISTEVKTILGLEINEGTPIFIGKSNISHMEREHPKEFKQYYKYISTIIIDPDYIGLNPKDSSLEYIKTFKTTNRKYIKLAVRISNDGYLFARSLYEIMEKTVNNRVEKGMLFSLTEHRKKSIMS